MLIEVSKNPSFVLINDMRIETAPPTDRLLSAIGTPSRLYSGSAPAPTKPRNNQIQIFDEIGVCVYEHHYTRRATCILVWSDVREREFEFTPTSVFHGELRFDGIRMPMGKTAREFVLACPWSLQKWIAGFWRRKFGDFSVGFRAIGPKLPSGRRSKRRIVTMIDITWPHDNWTEPAS
jgi:hypothetical protein